jgi:hypothetical protein
MAMITFEHSTMRAFAVRWCSCGCGLFALYFWKWEFVWGDEAQIDTVRTRPDDFDETKPYTQE